MKTRCYVWTGAKTGRGAYGCFDWTGWRERYVHRIAWILSIGDIPEGMQLDHRCETPLCVRLKHLKLVTNRENNRQRVKKITHCPQGHSYGEYAVVFKRLTKRKREKAYVQISRTCAACYPYHMKKLERQRTGVEEIPTA